MQKHKAYYLRLCAFLVLIFFSLLVSFGYDQNGNLKTQTDEEGHTTSYEYDRENRLLSITDPLGNKTLFTYDPLGRVTQIEDALHAVSQSSYDGDGNLLSSGDRAGRIRSWWCVKKQDIDKTSKIIQNFVKKSA